MACATLKRPLEWSDPSMSPDGSDQPPADYGSHNFRPAKRRCSTHLIPNHRESSPFGDVQPKISADDIATSIREEMMRLYHRKKLHKPNEACHSTTIDSDSNCSHDGSSSPTHGTLSRTSIGLLSPSRRDSPLFTFRQVSLICDRLIKERESQIRQEYDSVLTSKLAEQYDTFVKFTYDQIQKRFENGSIPSYLS